MPLYCLKIHLPNRTVIPRKPSKRRLWRIQRGGFKKVSQFSRHNVVGNRDTTVQTVRRLVVGIRIPRR